MLILLDAMMNISKKKISASSIAVLILFIVRLYIVKNQNGIIDVIIVIAGGLCGSLFAFIASPKARKARKENSGGLLSKAERIAQIDKESPRNKRKPAYKIPGCTFWVCTTEIDHRWRTIFQRTIST